MKNIFTILLILTISNYASAFTIIGRSENATQVSAEENGISYTKTFGIAPDSFNANKISAVVTYSSVTLANVSFSTNAYSNTSGDITISAHGLTQGIPVYLDVISGVAPPPLVDGTTYFAFPVSANVVSLSTTLAKAQINDPILFTSSKPADGTQTYTITLASTGVQGAPSFSWQGSNDGTHFFDLGVTTSPVGPLGIWNHDFDKYNYSILQLTYTAPTAPGWIVTKIRAFLNLKK